MTGEAATPLQATAAARPAWRTWALRVAVIAAGVVACWLVVGTALGRIYDEGRAQTDEEYFHLMRGPAVLIVEELRRTPRAQWPEVLARVQRQFEYEIRVKPISAVKFMPTERLRVLRGEMARGDEDQVDIVHYRIGDSDDVLAMGPTWVTPVRSDYVNFVSVRLLGTLALVVLIAFPLVAGWAWLAPVRRDVRLLRATVDALAAGNGPPPAVVAESALLAPLAAGVARTARNWQALVDSQRELSRAVSHELRTPVARLRFGLALLDERARAGNERVLDSLEHSLADLEDLVEASLAYARYTQARPMLDLHERAPLPWVREELARLAPQAGGPALEAAGDAELKAIFDPAHMRFALRNLVGNALRFAASRVQVTVGRADGGRLARIDVDDDGAGVPEADHARIFQPFVRGRQPERTGADAGGHGLGLSIAARVVDWHGGRIELARSPAGGARFSLVWPLEPAMDRRGAGKN
ncbi:MAG: ATP-binding protein [Burkholderiaceae bacterium]